VNTHWSTELSSINQLVLIPEEAAPQFLDDAAPRKQLPTPLHWV
jgi:hypothetical protein